MFIQTVADLYDPTIPFGSVLAARYEARLLQTRHRSTPPMLLGAGFQVLVEQAIHQQATGAAAAQLDRAAWVHFEQPAMAISATGETIIDAGEFGGRCGQAFNAGKIRRVGIQVHRPASQITHGLSAVERCPMNVREEREHVVLRLRSVEVDFATFLEGVQHVARETVTALEPAYVAA